MCNTVRVCVVVGGGCWCSTSGGLVRVGPCDVVDLPAEGAWDRPRWWMGFLSFPFLPSPGARRSQPSTEKPQPRGSPLSVLCLSHPNKTLRRDAWLKSRFGLCLISSSYRFHMRNTSAWKGSRFTLSLIYYLSPLKELSGDLLTLGNSWNHAHCILCCCTLDQQSCGFILIYWQQKSVENHSRKDWLVFFFLKKAMFMFMTKE